MFNKKEREFRVGDKVSFGKVNLESGRMLDSCSSIATIEEITVRGVVRVNKISFDYLGNQRNVGDVYSAYKITLATDDDIRRARRHYLLENIQTAIISGLSLEEMEQVNAMVEKFEEKRG